MFAFYNVNEPLLRFLHERRRYEIYAGVRIRFRLM